MLVAGRGAVVYEEEGWVVSRGAGELLAAGARPRAVRGPNSPADAGPRGAAARVRVSARRGALWALPLPLCPTVSLCILLLSQGVGGGGGEGPEEGASRLQHASQRAPGPFHGLLPPPELFRTCRALRRQRPSRESQKTGGWRRTRAGRKGELSVKGNDGGRLVWPGHGCLAARNHWAVLRAASGSLVAGGPPPARRAE